MFFKGLKDVGKCQTFVALFEMELHQREIRENPENLQNAKVAFFRRDFEIGHLVGVLAYLPLPKNRKIGFGHATAQNRAHISTVQLHTIQTIKFY